jgi:hypothetical protein
MPKIRNQILKGYDDDVMDQLNMNRRLRMRADQPPKTLCSGLEYWMRTKPRKWIILKK